MVTEAIARPRVPDLYRFPDLLENAPTVHRAVLAIVAAYEDHEHEPISWKRIVALTKDARSAGLEPFTDFPHAGLSSMIVTVVDDLEAQGVLQSTRTGLILTERAKAHRPNWNGPLTALVNSLAAVLPGTAPSNSQ